MKFLGDKLLDLLCKSMWINPKYAAIRHSYEAFFAALTERGFFRETRTNKAVFQLKTPARTNPAGGVMAKQTMIRGNWPANIAASTRY